MTLDEIRRSDKAYLVPTDVAEVFGCSPHAIRLAAQERTLEFPYVQLGTRTKIPRVRFLAWMDAEDMNKE